MAMVAVVVRFVPVPAVVGGMSFRLDPRLWLEIGWGVGWEDWRAWTEGKEIEGACTKLTVGVGMMGVMAVGSVVAATAVVDVCEVAGVVVTETRFLACSLILTLLSARAVVKTSPGWREEVRDTIGV